MNDTLHREDLGRLFAVIHVQGKQRKVTAEDLVVLRGHFYPTIGDKIRMEKVNTVKHVIWRMLNVTIFI